MTLIRGRGTSLELNFADVDFNAGLTELGERLSERPGFYRGTEAVALFGKAAAPSAEQLERLREVLGEAGITLRGVEQTALAEELVRRRAERPKRELKLSDSARSLVADFAGARADIAQRRKRGDTSVPRVQLPDAPPKRSAPPAPALTIAPAPPPPPGTLYHVGTLRGGQALHHAGNIVIVGDVNPGTELIATGDIVVFGRLLGVAHAGAQGDLDAKVYALGLQATQLRIATCIAVDEETRTPSAEPEVACVRDGRIVIAPFSKAAEV